MNVTVYSIVAPAPSYSQWGNDSVYHTFSRRESEKIVDSLNKWCYSACPDETEDWDEWVLDHRFDAGVPHELVDVCMDGGFYLEEIKVHGRMPMPIIEEGL